jgi:hypothetical protein
MLEYEVTCANKNPNGMLVRIGGENWTCGLREAIVKIVSGQALYSVRIEGKLMTVGIRGESSNAYLVLEPEGYPLHDLPDLPGC